MSRKQPNGIPRPYDSLVGTLDGQMSFLKEMWKWASLQIEDSMVIQGGYFVSRTNSISLNHNDWRKMYSPPSSECFPNTLGCFIRFMDFVLRPLLFHIMTHTMIYISGLQIRQRLKQKPQYGYLHVITWGSHLMRNITSSIKAVKWNKTPSCAIEL